MGETTFAFETKRLRVFEAAVRPWPDRPASTVYLAFHKEPGAAQTVAQAIVTDRRSESPPPPLPLYCELLEVSAMFRGAGFGRELFLELEARLGGRLKATASTPEGEKFLKNLGRETDAFAAQLEPMYARITESSQFRSELEAEQLRVRALPAGENPASPDFQGDGSDSLLRIAPFTLFPATVRSTTVPLSERLDTLERLIPIISGRYRQVGETTPTGG